MAQRVNLYLVYMSVENVNYIVEAIKSAIDG